MQWKKEWCQRNREKYNKYQREYRAKKRLNITEKQRAERNRKHKEWCKKNREKRNKYRRELYAKKKARMKEEKEEKIKKR